MRNLVMGFFVAGSCALACGAIAGCGDDAVDDGANDAAVGNDGGGGGTGSPRDGSVADAAPADAGSRMDAGPADAAIPEDDAGDEDSAAKARAALALVALACRSGGLDPLAVVASDLKELRTRPYLAAYFGYEDGVHERDPEREHSATS